VIILGQGYTYAERLKMLSIEATTKPKKKIPKKVTSEKEAVKETPKKSKLE
tara:strand:+ start:409 stop:561 length:153 start_codon:yes stop_codon:yes gene_type:complete